MNPQPDILKSQRPSKKPRPTRQVSKKLFSNLLLYLVQPLPFLFCLYALIGSKPNSDEKLNPSDIVLQQEPPDSPDKKKPIEQNRFLIKAEKHLKSGSLSDMHRLTENLISNSEYQLIHLIKVSHHEFRVRAEKTNPVLVIEADKLRFISETFQVYGSGLSSDLPVLKGIFSDKKEPFTMVYGNFLALTPSQSQRIRQAVHLRHLLSDSNLEVVEIHFKKFRGFLAILKNAETEVHFGIPPFSGKIKKLHSILQELAKKGRYASRVELDFEDKAFVKEKLY